MLVTADHHILNAKSGKAVTAASLVPGDQLLVAVGGSQRKTVVAELLSNTQTNVDGAYSPLLTNGALLVVDSVVAYPSAGTSDVGLEAKHWVRRGWTCRGHRGKQWLDTQHTFAAPDVRC